jgi:hypothetical protein
MSKVFEDLLKWVNSEEGIKALEVERQKLLFLDELSDKYIDKLHSMSLENRSELIDKIITKYESDEYKDREMFKLHYEPRNTLYWYLDDYAEKYGEELPNEENNPFPHSIRMIDNKYIVRKMYGQGTVIDVWKVE